jgi:hypothetical protein
LGTKQKAKKIGKNEENLSFSPCRAKVLWNRDVLLLLCPTTRFPKFRQFCQKSGNFDEKRESIIYEQKVLFAPSLLQYLLFHTGRKGKLRGKNSISSNKKAPFFGNSIFFPEALGEKKRREDFYQDVAIWTGNDHPVLRSLLIYDVVLDRKIEFLSGKNTAIN